MKRYDISVVKNMHSYRSSFYALSPKGRRALREEFPNFPSVPVEVETVEVQLFIWMLEAEYEVKVYFG